MGYKINSENENPLWRNYMDKLETFNLKEQTDWMKEVEPPVDLPFKTKSYAAYTEEEFLELLVSDSKFKEKWGTI